MAEQLNNRTGGEFRYMFHKDTFDTLCITCTAMFDNACEDFEQKKLTKGDQIRALSDEKLAELFVYGRVYEYDRNYGDWYSTLLPGTVCFSNRQKAIEATVEVLQKGIKYEK